VTKREREAAAEVQGRLRAEAEAAKARAETAESDAATARADEASARGRVRALEESVSMLSSQLVATKDSANQLHTMLAQVQADDQARGVGLAQLIRNISTALSRAQEGHAHLDHLRALEQAEVLELKQRLAGLERAAQLRDTQLRGLAAGTQALRDSLASSLPLITWGPAQHLALGQHPAPLSLAPGQPGGEEAHAIDAHELQQLQQQHQAQVLPGEESAPRRRLRRGHAHAVVAAQTRWGLKDNQLELQAPKLVDAGPVTDTSLVAAAPPHTVGCASTGAGVEGAMRLLATLRTQVQAVDAANRMAAVPHPHATQGVVETPSGPNCQPLLPPALQHTSSNGVNWAGSHTPHSQPHRRP